MPAGIDKPKGLFLEETVSPTRKMSPVSKRAQRNEVADKEAVQEKGNSAFTSPVKMSAESSSAKKITGIKKKVINKYPLEFFKVENVQEVT